MGFEASYKLLQGIQYDMCNVSLVATFTVAYFGFCECRHVFHGVVM